MGMDAATMVYSARRTAAYDPAVEVVVAGIVVVVAGSTVAAGSRTDLGEEAMAGRHAA